MLSHDTINSDAAIIPGSKDFLIKKRMKPFVFTKTSRIPAPVQDVFQWHERPGALERLVPPWDPLDVVFKSPGIDRGARTVMKIPAHPLPVKLTWVAAHTEYTRNKSFQDQQIKGPFKHWVHTHLFTPEGNHCRMEDRVEFALPFYMLGALGGNAAIHRKLNRIFRYRHATLKQDLAHHRSRNNQRPLTILISGASGVVGSALIPFLTTGGHRVIRLVRNPSPQHPNEIYWDPFKGELDLKDIHAIDAAIHLSGENIGQGRWTRRKKQKIIDSRNRTTRVLAQKLSHMAKPPRVFICASAIGFYGHRGDSIMTETNECGADFISGVCNEWETSASPAMDKGIRVAFLRIGVVLTPRGGALQKFLLPFNLGMGGKIGSGSQYISWISIDDLIYAIYHIINNDALHGPVNLVSPTPVTNARFTRTLGKVLKRPTLFTIPAGIIQALYGEMGREILLASTRVMPQKIMDAGFDFRYPDLELAMRHLLGR
jgi:uncharacterized protein (TIGR01777 family)